MGWEYRVFFRTGHGGVLTSALRELLGLSLILAEERTDFYVAGTGANIGLKARGAGESGDSTPATPAPGSSVLALAPPLPSPLSTSSSARDSGAVSRSGDLSFELKYLRSAYEGAAELGKVEITLPAVREWLCMRGAVGGGGSAGGNAGGGNLAIASAASTAAAAAGAAALDSVAAVIKEAPLVSALERLGKNGASLAVRKRRWKGAAGEVTECTLIMSARVEGAFPLAGSPAGVDWVTFCTEASKKDVGDVNVVGAKILAELRVRALMPPDDRVLIASYAGWLSAVASGGGKKGKG